MSDELLEKSLVDFYAQFIKFQNLKDMQGVSSCLDQESIMAGAMVQTFEDLFDHFTLDVLVLEHQYVGRDDDFFYWRFKHKIEKIAGPEFNDMCAENLVILRRDGSTWKVWNSVPLFMEPV